MTKPWNPRGPKSTPWLSPEAYNALSTAEKRALWFQRQAQRKRRSSTESTPAIWLVVAGIFLVVWAYEFGIPMPSSLRPHSAPVRAEFSYCYIGGGTNCVVDGDTFWIGGEKVRIANIDAPETHPSRCDDEERLGNAATEKLHSLLNSGAVTMTSIDRDRDIYGRLLRNVQVDGKDVGDALVIAGVAREWTGHREPWC